MKKFSDIYEKKVGVVQRKKMARRMSKMAKSPVFKLKKKRAALKIRATAKLTVLAKKKLVQGYRDKMFPGYKDMAPAQRVIADQRIQQKYGAKIAKLLPKAVMKLKKGEVERVKKARAAFNAAKDSE